jgi:eukaryotic-like serine/threonine-protein kinase
MREEPRTEEAPGTGVRVASPDPVALPERFGRYEVVMPLAAGGMGVVFVARLRGNHGLERLFALKTLRPITSRTERTALLQEARVTGRLRHRNVVATVDIGDVGDVPFVVMELVDGVALSRLLAQQRKSNVLLSPPLAAWIAMQAAFGLHAAHELADEGGRPLHLVHRDLTPHNILLSSQGDVKITDFGIAKFRGREESTAEGTIKGKFSYMSPEQATDAGVDRRSDVFTLGVVLWEMLTGRRLFAADSPARAILAVIELDAEPASRIRPEVGDLLSQIAERCLAKKPEDRYATALDLAEALRDALRSAGSPVDETDLAAVVAHHFADGRAAFMKRLEEASEAKAAPQVQPSVRVERRSVLRPAAIAFVAALAASAFAWRGFRATTVGNPEASAAPSEAPASAASEAAAKSAENAVASSPAPPASAPAPSASGVRRSRSSPRTAPPSSGHRPVPSGAAPRPEGKPFESL